MMYEWDYFNRKETVSMDNSLLRTIPKVDELLNLPALRAVCADVPLPALTEAVRVELDALRAQLCSGECSAVPNADTLCSRIASRARSARLPALRSVINATGVTLHTNLGRACLSKRAAAAARWNMIFPPARAATAAVISSRCSSALPALRAPWS